MNRITNPTVTKKPPYHSGLLKPITFFVLSASSFFSSILSPEIIVKIEVKNRRMQVANKVKKHLLLVLRLKIF
jgi:hypothetical protein